MTTKQCKAKLVTNASVAGLAGFGTGYAYYKKAPKSTKHKVLKTIGVAILGSWAGNLAANVVNNPVNDCI